MSSHLAGKAREAAWLEPHCSVLRHVNVLPRKRGQIVAVNLLMQNRVGPLMMYNQETLCLKPACYAH